MVPIRRLCRGRLRLAFALIGTATMPGFDAIQADGPRNAAAHEAVEGVVIESLCVLEDYALPLASGTQKKTTAPFVLGGLSDLSCASPCQHGPHLRAWAVTDRGPNGLLSRRFTAASDAASADRTLPLPSFSPLLVELEIAPSGIAGKAGVVRVLQSIALHTRSDQPTSGRPPGGPNDQPLIDPTSKKAVGFDPNGIDPEGMVRLRNGSFWIAEEYAPSLLEVSAEGRVLSRFIPFGQRLPVADSDVRGVLPAAYACRRDNRGFESLGCSPDESLLYCLLQSPIELPKVKKKDMPGNVRLLVFNTHSKRPVAEHIYRLGDPATSDGDSRDPAREAAQDGKLSGMAVMPDGRLLVLEQSDDESRVYQVDLRPATNTLKRSDGRDDRAIDAVRNLTAQGVRTVKKTLVGDLTPLAARFEADIVPHGSSLNATGLAPRKVSSLKFEGIAFLGDTRVAVVNDNDFDTVADGSAPASPPQRRTCLWVLRLPGLQSGVP